MLSTFERINRINIGNNHLIFVLASTNAGVGPFVIRTCTRSDFSHVALIDVTGNSKFESIPQDGVVKITSCLPLPDQSNFNLVAAIDSLTSVATLNGETLVVFAAVVTSVQRALMLSFLENQVGKQYDWEGCFKIFNYTRDWTEDSNWFCSELVASAFASATIPLIHKPSGRVTPDHCATSCRLFYLASTPNQECAKYIPINS